MKLDKHHPVIIALLMLMTVALFWLSHNTERVQWLQEQRAEGYRSEQELFNQNQELVRANLDLRTRIMELSENLTSAQASAQQCLESTPLGLSPNATRPHDRIDLDDVRINSRSVLIDARDVTPGLVGPSGSMRPLLDDGSIVLELPVQKPTDVFPGDIIIYELDGTRIIHRIIAIGYDDNGWYVITKGDSNPEADSQKVRFDQIRGVVVGVIY